MYLVTGANLFGQWLLEKSIIDAFENVSHNSNKNNLHFNPEKAQLTCVTWSYNVFRHESGFYLCGSWRGKENQIIKLSLPEECNSLQSNLTMVGNDFNLLLIDTSTRTIWVISLEFDNNIKKISLNTEIPISDENTVKKIRKDSSVIKVVATNNSLLFLTAEGIIYSGMLPSHLDTSHCEGNVCDIQCGYEHFVLLTDVGKVYTWGNGRRIQLGHGDLTNLESPMEVEALAGIKIIKISAGGWHSLAISEFGDLYAWGWNDTGQLGIKSQTTKEQGVLVIEGLKSYPIPTLVDVYDENDKEVNKNVKDVACGSRHTVILLEDYSIWTTGYNKYGQLGFPPETHPTVNHFKKTFHSQNNVKLMCGTWSTILANYKK